ncbi:hypothetical protein [Streptomyces sp. 147326]|uniref:hypothetical protein n=1 Tax=Streptomyces sp. 147326 TaxID=3074379 RepID=UPI00385766D6
MASPSDGSGGGDVGDATELEEWAGILSGGQMKKLVDLESMIADAPEDGGGPNWDKRSALSAIDEVKKHR